MSESERSTKPGRLAWLPAHRVTKWLIVVFWLVTAVFAFGPSTSLNDITNNDAVSWLPADAESTKVLNQMDRFHDSAEVSTVVIYERAEGLKPSDIEAVRGQLPRFDAVPGVNSGIIGPIPAQDGRALEVIVPVVSGGSSWTAVSGAVDEMRAIAERDSDGMRVHFTGPGGFAADQAEAFAGIDGKLLYSAIAVVMVILLLTYRSPVLWLLPLASALVAVVCAQAVVYLLAKHTDITVNAQSTGILAVLVLGAGTDYALLLVARYREELRAHTDRHQAMAVALRHTGPAIFASAATVIAGMMCLALAGMNSTQGMGPIAAIGVAVGLVVMLTLLPALLVICDRWVFWPTRAEFGGADRTERGVWARVGRAVARRPRTTWVTTTVALAAVSIGLVQLNATGLAPKDAFYSPPDSVIGAEVLARHFPAGAAQPIMVIAKADQAEAVRSAFQGVSGVDPASVVPARIEGDLALLQGTMTSAPNGAEAEATVDRVRRALHDVPGAEANVGGATATVVDTQRAAQDDNRLIIPVVLVVVLLILMLLLRSLLAPLLLIGTVVLSYTAALGLSALFFRHVFGFAGADSTFPLFVFVFLVALGIDYNIFLMTRVHEEAKRVGTRRGALIGLRATGGVITSAGLVLAGTFAVLSTLPVVAFAEIGFAVALGVLLDTFIVRSVLVTALNLDFGRTMWWPSRLSRRPEPAPPRSEKEPEHV